MKTLLKNLLLVGGALVITGCATSRGIIEVESAVVDNPDTGQAVKFVRVSDNREFFIDPPEANMPSLKGGEIGSSEITARAIARKRNSFGQALGDILLPEGETAAGLVQEKLTGQFRDSGYRVVVDGDPDFAEAIPLEVDIDKFWGWFQPGFWQIKLQFETSVTLQGPLEPFVSGKIYENKSELGAQVASEKNWIKALQANLDDISSQLSADL